MSKDSIVNSCLSLYHSMQFTVR